MKLEGVRVIDLSVLVPGPYLTTMMADHGAHVVKVEPYPHGDPARHFFNEHLGDARADQSELFRRYNHGKQSLRLNLKDPRGRDVLLRLAERADVIVESFRPGVMDRLGLGYDAVAARAPQIVYCSISGFGQTGPYKDRPTHNRPVEAMSGTFHVVKTPEGIPAVTDDVPRGVMAGSLMALNGILMALLRQRATGRGDYLDIALVDALFTWAPLPLELATTDAEPVDYTAPFRNIYETRDGRFIMLGSIELHFAEALLAKAGRPDLLELCRHPVGPVQEPVKVFLREFFRTRSYAEWQEWFSDIDVAWAPIRTLREVLADPATHERGMILHDAQGRPCFGPPIKFRNEPARPQLASPALGADTAAILAGAGYTPEDIDALVAAKVV